MAGIYIHIPFCKQACHYCNFHFSTSLQFKNELLQALLFEIKSRKSELEDKTVKTIYFGGGTPGILHSDEIKSILDCIRAHYSLSLQEVTIEMNPDDVNNEKVLALKRIGIDRISLGIQSFYEEDLLYMNRSHSAQLAKESLACIKKHFDNYSLDLIYGYPILSDDKLQFNIQTALEYEPPHISIYGMTIEPQTVFAHDISKGKMPDMDLDQQQRQFEHIMKTLGTNGFEHYEISSYAQAGFEAIHNTSYWEGVEYIGFGPGAHSFNGKSRSWNVANNAVYTKGIKTGVCISESEELTKENILNEYIMTSLRQHKGMCFEELIAKASIYYVDYIKKQALPFVKQGILLPNDLGYRLSTKGKLVADKVAAALFL